MSVLRRRCEARLHDLPVPDPFYLERFVTLLAERRGRPLHLRPVATGVEPHGFWLATARADYIFFDEATSPLHQTQIILHELAHIICEHRNPLDQAVSFPPDLFPDLSPDVTRLFLKRAAYSSEEEREAEILATRLLEHVGRSSGSSSASLDAETAWLRDRIAAEYPTESESKE